ncbi:6-phosphofructokinase [Cognatazoarcus halotolerans]|uniref:6-phosphofructokinase n=1 Tax=Cognatazoarcus halotolerans TaxID=2686016 RepID=UPI00135ADCDF|nr:6-phosphofructokinase [Cognatazoarcus halotolerans]MCB1900109.1 6-phosphofructokinase [Rhodocyclaceae bacterium]MCP5311292.1 6-phosphofructokinase [Zoogloeaceae bacterium]
MAPPNALYAQSGGVTAVINASACGVIETARRHPRRIGRMLAARNGILGLLSESLVDTGSFANDQLIGMRNTPGGIFGSCRFDLDEERDNPAQYDRIFEVLATHRVGYLFYNGGNGSMRTARQIAESALRRDYPLVVVGIPKTVDNDIVETDCCPGYGSAIKYLATSMREASIDLASMSTRRGRVFVLEVMGRNAGWLAAGCGLAADREDAAPHLVLLPEVTFDEARVLAAIKTCVARLGYCAIAVAEGVRSSDGKALAQVATDPAGYVQLGGAGAFVAGRVASVLGYKVHHAIGDYLQRAARHLVSATDDAQAHAVGVFSVEAALRGQSGVCCVIRRTSSTPYCWQVDSVPLADVADFERTLPPEYIRGDGLHVSEAFRAWAQPLITGECLPAFRDGLPRYWQPRLVEMPRLLEPYTI